jgi:CRISPR-associated protein Cas6
MFIDLLFSAHGDTIAIEHAYPLYAALSRLVPAFHDPNSRLRFAPISGLRGEPGRLRLTNRSCLRVRLPSDEIRVVLPLAGKALDVAGASIRLGTPSVYPLEPAPILQAPLVTFKHGEEPETFLKIAKEKLAALEIAGKPEVRVFQGGPRAGEPRRRVIRLKEQKIIGYSMVVSELSADESIRLQEEGLGGRSRMGCGFFMPARER